MYLNVCITNDNDVIRPLWQLFQISVDSPTKSDIICLSQKKKKNQIICLLFLQK